MFFPVIGSFIQKRTGLGFGGKAKRAAHLKKKATKAQAKGQAVKDIDTAKADIAKEKQKAKDYIEELKNSSISGIHHIIEMTEAYIKFFDKDAGNEDYKLKMYYKMTEALDESRSQSLKKMIPLTYESMYNRKAEE